jgi:hypothetical protein
MRNCRPRLDGYAGKIASNGIADAQVFSARPAALGRGPRFSERVGIATCDGKPHVIWGIGMQVANAAILALLLGLSHGAHADNIAGIGAWGHYHHSLDPTPITIAFVHEKGRRDFPKLTIPRSFVVYAHKAPPSTKAPLPLRLDTDQVQIAFTDPDGPAWTAALKERRAQIGHEQRDAAKELRGRFHLLQARAQHQRPPGRRRASTDAHGISASG